MSVAFCLCEHGLTHASMRVVAAQAAMAAGTRALFATQQQQQQPTHGLIQQTIKTEPQVPQLLTNAQGQIVAIGTPSQVSNQLTWPCCYPRSPSLVN